MKKRGSFYILVLIIMVAVLGVGYAVVSSVYPQITGTAETQTKNLNVVISAATPTNGNTIGGVSNPADLSATITVSNMTGTTDSRTVTYTVSNGESDLDAKVYVDTPATDIIVHKHGTTTDSEHFVVSTSVNGEANAIIVPANGTATFTVTVSLSALPITAADSSADITINLTADPIPKSNNSGN